MSSAASKFVQRHAMRHQRFQAYRAAIHQIDHHRKILRRGGAIVDERQFLEIKIVERQGAAGCVGDAEQSTMRPPKRAMRMASAMDAHHAGALNHHVGAAAIGCIQNLRHRGRTGFDHHVRAQLLRKVVLESAAADPDHIARAARLGELHVQLAGHAEPDHRDRFAQRHRCARRCACKQVVATWISGAIRRSSESGSRKTWLAGTAAYSANPPLVSRPIKPPAGQRLVCPIRQ